MWKLTNWFVGKVRKDWRNCLDTIQCYFNWSYKAFPPVKWRLSALQRGGTVCCLIGSCSAGANLLGCNLCVLEQYISIVWLRPTRQVITSGVNKSSTNFSCWLCRERRLSLVAGKTVWSCMTHARVSGVLSRIVNLIYDFTNFNFMRPFTAHGIIDPFPAVTRKFHWH